MEIGLALSGGGIRGIAHAGVIKALEENDIKINYIGGTSAGSMVAALYAMGYSPDNIHTLFKRYAKKLVKIDKKILKQEIKNYIFKKDLKSNGLNDGEDFEVLYNSLAFEKGIKQIKDIEMPLIIPSIDIGNSKKYFFSSIEKEDTSYITDITLGGAVRASSSFPVIYKPFKYKEHLFLDGGILDNIPAKEIKNLGAGKVISVRFDSNQVQGESNIMDVAIKALDIMGDKISEESLDSSDYIITVPTDGTGLLDIDKIEYCFKSGYETTKKEIEKLKQSLFADET